jgi:hypothetical protein
VIRRTPRTQRVIDEGPLVAGQPRDAGIDRLGPVVENGRLPPGGGVEEPTRAGLSEFRQVALDHGVEVAEQDRMFLRPVGVVLGLGAVDMDIEAPLRPVIVVDLDHRVPVIGVFAGIERGPVRARDGGDQPLDLLPRGFDRRQERHLPQFRAFPRPRPAAHAGARDLREVVGAAVHEAAIAEEEGIVVRHRAPAMTKARGRCKALAGTPRFAILALPAWGRR